jgi:hypothetical protein
VVIEVSKLLSNQSGHQPGQSEPATSAMLENKTPPRGAAFLLADWLTA